MKKIKSFFCLVLLSAFLAGNAFAGNTIGNGIYSFFDGIMNAVSSFVVGGGGDCKPRQCTNCEGPDCRPDGN